MRFSRRRKRHAAAERRPLVRGASGTTEIAMRMRRIPVALVAVMVTILPVKAGRASCTAFVGLHLLHAASAGQGDDLPRKGYFGVRLAPLSDEVRARGQLEAGVGVLIEAVVPGTTAADGGIRLGDVLLALDGRRLSSVADVMTTVAAMTVRQKFEVTLSRGGRRMILPMTLKERPRDRGETFDVLYHHVVSGGARIRTIVTKPHTPGRHPVLFPIPRPGRSTSSRTGGVRRFSPAMPRRTSRRCCATWLSHCTTS